MKTGSTQSSNNNSWQFALRLLVSLLALGWVIYSLRELDWYAAWDSFPQVSLAKIFACFSLVLVIYASRLFRLRFWIERFAANRMPVSQWVDIYLKSIALGSITPARLGDFSRIALLAVSGLGIREGSLFSLLTLWGVPPESIPVLLVWEFLLNMVFPLVLYAAWRPLAVQKKQLV